MPKKTSKSKTKAVASQGTVLNLLILWLAAVPVSVALVVIGRMAFDTVPMAINVLVSISALYVFFGWAPLVAVILARKK